MSIIQWTPKQLREQLAADPDLVLLDVREAHEYAFASLANSLHIPLGQIPLRYDELDPARHLAVLCHHGVRSMQACLFLQQQGFEQLYNVQGGIDAWSLVCDPSIPRY